MAFACGAHASADVFGGDGGVLLANLEILSFERRMDNGPADRGYAVSRHDLEFRIALLVGRTIALEGA